MNTLWTDINNALVDIIAYEEGNRFQRLAVALAKQRWPEIIATEIKKDGGEDALTHPYLTKDGKRISIACSNTPTIRKIRDDSIVKQKRGVSLDLLIFYTPNKVTNTTQDKWRGKIQREFGWDLIVIPREDIIQELIKPDNHWMCATFLKLPLPISQSVSNKVANAFTAASHNIEQWKMRYHFNPNQIINIEAVKLTDENKPTDQKLDYQSICTQLTDYGRIILYGEPGAGKTTTLIQIAGSLLSNNQQKVPLFISLPEWIESGDDIFTFITRNPDFIAAGITVDDVALLHQYGHLVFLFNGWNEIPASSMVAADRKINKVDREFPSAGIIVATRKHEATVPLLEPLKLKLLPVTHEQRCAFIVNALGDQSQRLLSQIETNPAISDITRTPLILSETVNLFKSGLQIFDTKPGVLRQVIKRMEESEEHSLPLKSEPIWGRANKYLCNISINMTREGRTTLSEDAAREAITRVNEHLMTEGQIASSPEPTTILGVLCSHHLLDKSDYPVSSIRFVHHQFQELFSAISLKDRLIGLIKNQDSEGMKMFQREIINLPTWEEPLKLLAEEISEMEGRTIADIEAIDIGKNLVDWSIAVDPVFAAELARLCGNGTWNAVKGNFVPLLRKWYKTGDESHKTCALSAMFVTGSNDFTDLILPLLEHDDQQIRLKTYRTAQPLFLSSLGQDWRKKVEVWEDERRVEFIHELSFNGGKDSLSVIKDFAEKDPSIKVKVAAIGELAWQGAISMFSQAIIQCDDETFREVVKGKHLPSRIPENILTRLTKTYKYLLEETDDFYKRIRILIRMFKIKEPDALNLLKAELAKISIGDALNYRDENIILQDIVKIMITVDEKWISEWILRKYIDGKLRGDYWLSFVHDIPETIIEEIVEQILNISCTENNVGIATDIIARGAGAKHAKVILEKLIELSGQRDETTVSISEAYREFYARLKRTAEALPLPVLVNTVITYYSEPKNMKIVIDLLGHDLDSDSDDRQSLSADEVESLRMILHHYFNLVLAEEDFDGQLKAYFSNALARFGDKRDIPLIEKVIYADIERRRKGKEAFLKGEKDTARVNGFRMSWSHMHVKALCKLDRDNANQILIPLLKEPDYEGDAGWALVRLSRKETKEGKGRISEYFEPDKIIRTRENILSQFADESKRKSYATVILEHINLLRQECDKSDNPDSINGRLKNMAAILARLNEFDAIPLILELMSLPGKWDGWVRLETLEHLIMSGAELNIDVVEQVINPTINQLIDEGIHINQNSYLLKRCLCIFLFTNNPVRAIERIKELKSYLPPYEMRDIITALGQSRSAEAGRYLIELAPNMNKSLSLEGKLIDALAKIDSTETRSALLSIIDSNISEPNLQLSFPYHASEIFSQALSKLSSEHIEIKDRIFQLCHEELMDHKREIIAQIINKIGTPEAVFAGLNLLSDKSRYPIPHALQDAVENILIDKRPTSEYSYTLVPSHDKEIRKHLLDMVLNDQLRKQSAYSMLGMIYRWRLEYGRPLMEPRHSDISKDNYWFIFPHVTTKENIMESGIEN